jgi:hypothetical protein
MTLAGFALPEITAWDPGVSGEGSLDPMGLGALSDRLADRLVPGVRARMQSIRFVTAMAVGATACETLADEQPVDDISTPAICFEWLVIEALVRRLSPQEMPTGVPGSQKARAVVNRRERLSAATYLKSPTVFGFNGVYKPFAIDAGVVSSDLEPGPRCAELTRSWEAENGFDGFTDAVDGTKGGALRAQICGQVRDALRNGKCITKPGSWLFGDLAASLRPDEAKPLEQRLLRSLITDGSHDTRSELAAHLAGIRGEMTEAALLALVRPSCSPGLKMIIDAVVAYEQLAQLIDAAFRTLCWASYVRGLEPLTPLSFEGDATFVSYARDNPNHYRTATERLSAIGMETLLEERLGEFAISRPPGEFFQLLLDHHDRVQANKPPQGKSPWFEPFRSGWIVRGPYATPDRPEVSEAFVHPVRIATLRRFVEDTAR